MPKHAGIVFRLAAPTGRAAKRMTEATGFEAPVTHAPRRPGLGQSL